MLCKILRLFVNTLTADDNCSLLNRDNVTEPIQILLSQKQKTVSQFFFAFLKSILNLEHLQKRMILIENMFPKLGTQKKVVRSMSKKTSLRGPLHKKHGKRAQTHLESGRRQLYHIC